MSDSIDTRSAGGELLLNVLMSVAQWEREALSERTQEAMNELKRRGIRTGGAGYGWQWSKKPDASGRKQRILPARCDVWHAESILDLLRQPSPSAAS